MQKQTSYSKSDTATHSATSWHDRVKSGQIQIPEGCRLFDDVMDEIVHELIAHFGEDFRKKLNADCLKRGLSTY